MRFLQKLPMMAAAAALAVGWAASAWADSAAERAVNEAKKYSGSTITIVWEAGLQSLDPLNFSGPMWQDLTGITTNGTDI